MKKVLIYVLVLLMAFSGVPAWAEDFVIDDDELFVDDSDFELDDTEFDFDLDDDEADEADEEEEEIEIEYDYNELVVANATPFSGNFFARMWGNLTSDLDVQMLIHGYNLVQWDSEEGAFAVDPSVVSGIVVTQNQQGDRTYTLALYDDLFYSDGSRITARDYAFALLLTMSPLIEEIGGSPMEMQHLVGYNDYISGAVDYLSGVRVINDEMLAITVSHEFLPFFYELGLLYCTPIPIGVVAPGCSVQDNGQGVFIGNADLFTADTLRRTILDPETGYMSHPAISSGPYRLLSYDGNQAEFEINEFYKGNSEGVTPTIPRLVYRTVEKDQMLEQFAAGEIGLLNKILDADQVTEGVGLVTRNSNTFTMTTYPRTGLGLIVFCCEQPTVSSVAVRKALSYCFDKDAVTGDTVSNFGLRVDGYYGLGQWMFQLLSGTIAYPVKEPAAGASYQQMQEYEEEMKKWEELNMDDVPLYDPDVEEAIRLLEEDGWTLNREGQPFDIAKDDVRCKRIDGELVALDLHMICPVENGFSDILMDAFVGLDEVGIRVDIENLPMQDVLLTYYREVERTCDLIFIANNFDVVFDPSINFMPDGEVINEYNFSAIDDEELYQLAVDMRKTEPEDVLEYVTKWVDFQTRLQEVAPIISIYSSVYFDFYPRVLQDYDVASNITWTQAIVYAFLGDAPELEEEEEGDDIELDDGEFIF